jgi:hypothetical protein
MTSAELKMLMRLQLRQQDRQVDDSHLGKDLNVLESWDVVEGAAIQED